MSASLLIQSIPGFEESTVVFPLKRLRYFFPPLLVLFPISVLTSLEAHGCSAGEVGYRMLGWLQAAWQQTAFCPCNSPGLFRSGLPPPPHKGCEVGWPRGGSCPLCHRDALPWLSTAWVMGSGQRPEADLRRDAWGPAGCPKAGLGCLSCGCGLMQGSKLDLGQNICFQV